MNDGVFVWDSVMLEVAVGELEGDSVMLDVGVGELEGDTEGVEVEEDKSVMHAPTDADADADGVIKIDDDDESDIICNVPLGVAVGVPLPVGLLDALIVEDGVSEKVGVMEALIVELGVILDDAVCEDEDVPVPEVV